MGKRGEAFENYPLWTKSRFFSFIRSNLRRTWMKYPPRNKALEDACVGRKTNEKTGKLAKHYRCAECDGEFPAKGVQVDHKIEVGTLKDWTDIEGFVRRLFCPKDELQVLCKDCHKNKKKVKLLKLYL